MSQLILSLRALTRCEEKMSRGMVPNLAVYEAAAEIATEAYEDFFPTEDNLSVRESARGGSVSRGVAAGVGGGPPPAPDRVVLVQTTKDPSVAGGRKLPQTESDTSKLQATLRSKLEGFFQKSESERRQAFNAYATDLLSLLELCDGCGSANAIAEFFTEFRIRMSSSSMATRCRVEELVAGWRGKM